ncbi:LacI family DNA-binding transcriptional regulator [Joostella atrarenae]|uniref:LacI family DNA-binding transcriptional regulator n=1 Tax=Joostella atrarenae TaxID=679257 RepID=A0ABS9IZ47_9FLAO|nr:LacI family DNA-binding transcriptional regulator [Joostella atrarenae]MCF8713453.1 LacI family DNA-binding transcriptional regulator [Joostella atrarenae]
MKKNKPTIHEIARLLNIDSSTVSRALNNSNLVTKATKEKVLKKAKEIGYQRNLLASNLRKSRSNTIGVIVPRISRHFFSSTIAGIEEAAYTHGYNVVIAQSMEQLEREKRIVGNLISNRVDGVLISVSMETSESNHLDRFSLGNIPLVFFDRCIPGGKNSKVLIDDYKASFEATSHLIEVGCKNIGHIAGPKSLNIYKGRLKGYKEALKANDIPFNSKLVHTSALNEKDGYEAAEKLLSENKNLDGIFSANDVAAIGAMKYLKSVGKSIPNDIAVVGFSNEPISEAIEPSLTTVDQSGYDIGKIACNLLIDSIKDEGDDVLAKTITLNPTLIKRDSTKRV